MSNIFDDKIETDLMGSDRINDTRANNYWKKKSDEKIPGLVVDQELHQYTVSYKEACAKLRDKGLVPREKIVGILLINYFYEQSDAPDRWMPLFSSTREFNKIMNYIRSDECLSSRTKETSGNEFTINVWPSPK